MEHFTDLQYIRRFKQTVFKLNIKWYEDKKDCAILLFNQAMKMKEEIGEGKIKRDAYAYLGMLNAFNKMFKGKNLIK